MKKFYCNFAGFGEKQFSIESGNRYFLVKENGRELLYKDDASISLVCSRESDLMQFLRKEYGIQITEVRDWEPDPYDMVEVRSFEDMLESYGGSASVVGCEYGFVDDMSHLCGKQFLYKDADKVFKGWTHSIEMLKPAGCGDLYSDELIRPFDFSASLY